jgi:hypothetical protein
VAKAFVGSNPTPRTILLAQMNTEDNAELVVKGISDDPDLS